MPTIDFFDGIKICIYGGDLPNRQLKKVFDWLAGNSSWVLEVFYELNPELL